MDSHDLQMFDLEMAAVDHLNQAALALKNGNAAASKDVEHWSMTLEHIRQLKAALGQLQPDPGPKSKPTNI